MWLLTVLPQSQQKEELRITTGKRSLKMRCKILASFLLLFSVSSRGAVSGDSVTILGALGRDFNLTIPGFQMTDDIDEVRWKKGKTLVAEFKRKTESLGKSKAFEILTNGALQIKKLKKDDSGTYNVIVYDTNGHSRLEKTFELKILEMVSKPVISWECSSTTVTCNITEGTEVELRLEQGRKHLISLQKSTVSHKWTSLNAPFTCTAANRVSKESTTATVTGCSDRGLHLYYIAGACSGGLLLVVLGALLIFCICKRRKQNRRRKDEELEIKAPRTSTVERGPKSYPTPAAASQNPVASQAPPPPSHHRPLPPSHRTREPQHKKRPPPSGTQVHQQKGPPLPRPRVQPKPPCGGGEDASLPPPN